MKPILDCGILDCGTHCGILETKRIYQFLRSYLLNGTPYHSSMAFIFLLRIMTSGCCHIEFPLLPCASNTRKVKANGWTQKSSKGAKAFVL